MYNLCGVILVLGLTALSLAGLMIEPFIGCGLALLAGFTLFAWEWKK
jgi:hypothetical protein